MNGAGKLHALLSTSRVANIPSVLSNVWLGVVVGLIYRKEPGSVPWAATGWLMCSCVALYVAGNFLNDWMDREWDGAYRPERALPRGLFTLAAYRNTAFVLFFLGIAVAASVNHEAGAVAAAIVACVVIYTIWHKRAAWTVVPMGLCRALLPVMGAAAMGHVSWMPALAGAALFCHIVGLSLSARNESRGGDGFMPVPWFLFSPVLMGLMAWFGTKPLHVCFIGIIPYGLWIWRCRTTHRRPIPRYVSALLAGIPLVDWILLLPFSIGRFTINQAVDETTVACFIIPPLAFLLALCLQRVAPAT